ncbi:MAG: effector-associated domain EAD1-containing protein [Caldilineaceae bacterium]
MDWLNMQWLSTYWVPLTVMLVFGFLLGWLLTGISPRRRVMELQAQVADLESRSRKSERDLTDVRKQVDTLKNSLHTTENTLSDTRAQLHAEQNNVQQLGQQNSELRTELNTVRPQMDALNQAAIEAEKRLKDAYEVNAANKQKVTELEQTKIGMLGEAAVAARALARAEGELKDASEENKGLRKRLVEVEMEVHRLKLEAATAPRGTTNAAVNDGGRERPAPAADGYVRDTRRTQTKLSGKQIRQIQEAIVSGYSPDSLRSMVRTHLDESLHSIATGDSFNTQVFSLIEWAEQQGRIEELVQAAYEANPNNTGLRNAWLMVQKTP